MNENKLTVIGSKSYQQCEVIMLPTKEQRWTVECEHDNRYEFYSFTNDKKLYSRQNNVHNWSLSHLYILSSEEIKKGDWCYDVINKIIEQAKFDYGSSDNQQFFKIIATTDFSLTHIVDWDKNAKDIMISVGDNPKDYQNYKSLPRPSDDFIKAFVKAQGKGFDKVLVEYQAYHGIKTSIAEVNAISGDDSMNWQGRNDLRDYKIKVSPDNTITIKPIQEEKTSWNREEVVEILKKFDIEMGDTHGPTTRNKWIEENL